MSSTTDSGRSARRKGLRARSRRAYISLAATCGAVAAAGALLLAAGSQASPTAKASAKPVPYVLGVQASLSGPLASSIGGYGGTMNAWADWTNAHGGINGHKVKLVIMDDAGNPTTGLAQVKQMVEQDHIIALINASGTEESYAAYLSGLGIPGIGGLDADPIYYTSIGGGDFFSQGTSPIADSAGSVALGKKAGITKLAFMYCTEVPACQSAGETVVAAAKAIGVDTVYSTGVSSSAPNYTAPCLAAKAAGANGLTVSAAASVQLGVAASCQQQGLKAGLETADINFTMAWLASQGSDGAVSALNSFPFTASSTPAEKQFHQALRAYYPNVLSTPAYGQVESSAWTSGQLFAAAAKNLGNKPTAKGVLKGLYALHGNTLNGLSGPITYVHGDNPNQKLNCYFALKISSGKFVPVNNNKAICPK